MGKNLVTILGMPQLTANCHPGKITPTAKPKAPTDVQAINISSTEVGLTWNYEPDLENGLPSFRIYRNNSLIATLQGQDYTHGDEPSSPQVWLEFLDKEATADSIYSVSAINIVGESISKPIHLGKKSKSW